MSDDREQPSEPPRAPAGAPTEAPAPVAARTSRRGLLAAAAALAGAAAVGSFAVRVLAGGPPPRTTAPPATSLPTPRPRPTDLGMPAAASEPPPLPPASRSELFTLGVASGEPLPDGVVLWTWLAPEPLSEDGGMRPRPVTVDWQIADDAGFGRVVAGGSVRAEPRAAHTVHVEVGGLKPDRWYFYRFRAAGEISPVGRTRTAPAPGASPQRLRFAMASCQDWQDGWWPAYAAMADEDLDLVLHLGDYIYEEGVAAGAVRRHEGPAPRTLAEYRIRHALYKTDANLQAAHAAFPWVVTFDDHDVANDYAAAHAADGTPAAAFLALRAAAYQAYWEHLPLRRGARPSGPAMSLYRRLTFGDLLALHVLDTRQYRSPQPCGGGLETSCLARLDPAATMTGPAQERWLMRGLAASPTLWNAIAQQVMFAQLLAFTRDGDVFNMDQWDGYLAARSRLLRFLDMAQPPNPMVLSGDLHSSWVNQLQLDFDDLNSPPVGVELVGTSISSNPPQGLELAPDLVSAVNPHVKYFDPTRRGYVRNDVNRARWRADFRTVERVDRPSSPTRTTASWVVESGNASPLPG